MLNSFQCVRTFECAGKIYHYCDLKAAESAGLPGISRLPFSLKILLENLLRHEDGKVVKKEDIQAFVKWLQHKTSDHEIAYHPARVLMQDFTGVPAVVDLAAMRDAMVNLKGDPNKINPLCPVDLVIDHSVQVDKFGSENAFLENVEIEMQRNHERYTFLKWGQGTFHDFRVVPPGTGICHQVNLEYLAHGIWASEKDGKSWVYPDTLVGTDSHTTMINGLGVLGWGVGGIEAEAAMLGQPVSMLIPEVIGFKLTGKLREGITATDLVLTVTQKLRQRGVVGKFVEYFGSGLEELPLADRATIANMAPEYGATCGLFPIDAATIKYLELSGRDASVIERVRQFSELQGTWHDTHSPEAVYTDILELDLGSVVPSLAGPKRPQDRVALTDMASATQKALADSGKLAEQSKAFPTTAEYSIHHGDVVIAAITSCTNTSNPSVMLAAGLVARKAVAKGLQRKPWVKSSLAPGSKVVTDYLKAAGVLDDLDKLGFYLVGYGCTTCIGNSGPLPDPVAESIDKNDLMVCSVLSGNRNFEGRVHPQVRANWLASPPLVVAFALAGTTNIDLTTQALGQDSSGKAVFLKDIWPTEHELAEAMRKVSHDMFKKEYAEVFDGDAEWKAINVKETETYQWDSHSTYVQNPPYFVGMSMEPGAVHDIKNARVLALLGDSVTTDHISPAGSIKPNSPAGLYLKEHGVAVADFNSYGSRRGNHEVMMRGTFANIRIRNEILEGVEGGYTKHFPQGTQMSIYDAAMAYQKDNVPLVIIAGKEYGTGSSRDWAAKGTLLLGVKAVITESFERIHRSNLIGMGVLPLRFPEGVSRKTLKLDGTEMISITGIEGGFKPNAQAMMHIKRANGSEETVALSIRIDTQTEYEYYRHGGILCYVLRNLARV